VTFLPDLQFALWNQKIAAAAAPGERASQDASRIARSRAQWNVEPKPSLSAFS
jgi:hypothetical protein